MREGLEGDWQPVIEIIADKEAALPFATFTTELPAGLTPQMLHEAYLLLYSNACKAVGISNPATDGQSQMSYNIGLTSRKLILCPRRAEGAEVTRDGQKGFVALNGTLLAGTLLVKNDLEWTALREDEAQLEIVLAEIGFPPTIANKNEKRESSNI